MTTTQMVTTTPFDLSAILHPLSMRHFIETYWGKEFAYIAGPPGKFSGLYGWEELNDLLALTRMASPRLRLIKKNRDIDPARYRTSSALPGRGALLNPAAFLSELAGGATLIVDEIDDTSRTLRSLMTSLEERFRVRVHANLYAGWGVDNGFPVHWDPHGTLVLCRRSAEIA